MEATTKTYWHKKLKGVRFVTDNPEDKLGSVFGELADLIYDHCRAEKRGQKDKDAREIKLTITG